MLTMAGNRGPMMVATRGLKEVRSHLYLFTIHILLSRPIQRNPSGIQRNYRLEETS